MPANLTAVAIEFASQTAILFVLLWIMVKLQKLDQNVGYNFLKLLGVAAIASGLDLIPYFGHYVSVSALLLGVKTVTRSPYADVLFTVAISYALMFGVNLLIIGSLMGDLRPSAGTPREFEVTNREPAIKEDYPATAKTNPPAPTTAANPVKPNPAQLAEGVAKLFSLKGVTRNAARSVVTIQAGAKTYSIFIGESAMVQTPDGPIPVRFSSLDEDWVMFEVGGEKVRLPAR